MPSLLTTHTRDEFMLFGSVIAQVLRERYPNQACVISMGGDGESGKSLLALVADADAHPERYPLGITKAVKIYEMIDIAVKDRKSVMFSDGLPKIYNTSDDNAQTWADVLAQNPDVRLVYLSNVWGWSRLTNDPRDPHAIKDNAVPIQMKCDVEVLHGAEFQRQITFKCFEPELEHAIKARFEETLAASSPAAPSRRVAAAPKPSKDV